MVIEEQVILVNEKDEQIGLMPKQEAHEKAILHRAFSVFIFNDKNEIYYSPFIENYLNVNLLMILLLTNNDFF